MKNQKQQMEKQDEKFVCEKCEKEMTDDKEPYEMGDLYVCQSCMEDMDSQAELMYEDKFRGIE